MARATNTTRRLGMTGQTTPAMLAMAATLAFGCGATLAADDVTEGQILRALTPKPLTRGLSMAPPTAPAVSASEDRFVDSLRNRTSRSLSSAEREQISDIAKTKPTIDLEITFDYNSATISKRAQPAVQALGKALSNPELKGATFIVAGHTDAAGSDSYNQDLSERRAEAIKRTLIDRFGVAGADLVTVGYGESKLKDPAHPMDGINRRVQVVNMANKATASQ